MPVEGLKQPPAKTETLAEKQGQESGSPPATEPDEDAQRVPRDIAEILDGESVSPQQGRQLVALLEAFSGPLPPPSVLQQYEEVCPGAAERILRLAEGQSKHRQQMEAKVVASDCRAQDRGPVYGFIVAMSALVLSGVLLYEGKTLLEWLPFWLLWRAS